MSIKVSNMGYYAKGKHTQILDVYESKPEGDGPFPTVVLFMHVFGVDDPMKKVCDDLAEAGFYALGYDGYLNGSYGGQNRSEDAIFHSFHTLLHWMERNPLVDMTKLGAIGFCMGGRHAYLANAYTDVFKAVVAYYGFPHRGDNENNTPQNRIADFTGAVLSIFGELDKGIPQDAVQAYQAASETSGKHSSIVYNGVGHGFLNPYSANHNKEVSEQAWGKTIEHFKKYLS